MIRKVKRAFLAALRRYAVVPVAFACSCGPFADPMAAESGNPDCGTDALAKIIAGRATELSEACGSAPVEKCAGILKDPVIAKWQGRLDAWERCE